MDNRKSTSRWEKRLKNGVKDWMTASNTISWGTFFLPGEKKLER